MCLLKNIVDDAPRDMLSMVVWGDKGWKMMSMKLKYVPLEVATIAFERKFLEFQ